MSPTSTGQLNTDVTGAMNQGSALQNQYNAQVPGLQSNYGQAQNQASQYGQQYSNFLNNLPQNYLSDLNSIGNQIGYNPSVTSGAESRLLPAEQSMATSQNIMNALPQAVNQMGNYSGATAGQVAQNYSNMAGNISQQAGNATNQMNALTGVLGAQTGLIGQMNQGAGNITGQQATGYGQLYNTSVQQMNTAGSIMSQIEGLQQQQGFLTAQQVAQYNAAYNSYQQGVLAATQAQAAQNVMGQAGAATTPGATIPGTNTANNTTYSNPSGQEIGYENPTTNQDVQLSPTPVSYQSPSSGGGGILSDLRSLFTPVSKGIF